MKQYNLIGINNDALKLQDNEGNIINAFENEVLYLPKTNVFVFKKDIVHKNKIKELKEAVFYSVLIALIMLVFAVTNYFYHKDDNEGYYRASDSNDNIHYEWVEGGDK